MLAIRENFDESELGYSKFSLFLKQADEHEVIELNRGDNGIYEVRVRKGAEALTPAPSDIPASTNTTDREARPARRAEVSAPATTDASDGSDSRRLRPRLSARRRGASGEPPPLLEGQAFTPSGAVETGAVGARGTEEPKSSAEPQGATVPQRAPRKGGKEQGEKVRGEKGRSDKPRSEKPRSEKPRSEKPRSEKDRAGKGEPPATASAAASDLPQLGLPADAESITQYLMNSYKGVGKKTADILVDAHGDRLFLVMETNPDAVRTLLPVARAEKLLEQWVDDVARRRAEVHGPAGRRTQEATPRRRGSAGGRGRGGSGRSSR